MSASGDLNTGHLRLYEGPLLSNRGVMVAANRKYLAALDVIASHPNVAPERGASYSAFAESVGALDSGKRNAFLSSAHYRYAIDAAFVDLYAGMEGRGLSKLTEIVTRADEELAIDSAVSLSIVTPDETGDHDAATIIEAFAKYMADDVSNRPAAVVSPTDQFVSLSHTAVELLAELDVHLLEQVVLHGRNVGYIDVKKPSARIGYREIAQSVSSHVMPSVFFVSYHSARDERVLAEAFLHESLHKKLSNTLYVWPLMSDTDYDGKFHSCWNRDSSWNSNLWDYSRTLYAYHFYVHFSAYFESPSFCERMNVNAARRDTTRERARSLFNWIKATNANYLSPEGWQYFRDLAERGGLLN